MTGRVDIFGLAGIAMVALVAVLLTLDPADCWPSMPAGPGNTLDESFNVQMGVYLTHAMREYGLAVAHPASLQEVFQNYNPDHPPLGRLWLGVFHDLTQAAAAPRDVPAFAVTASARTGSAVAFALTVWLIGFFTSRRWGSVAGCSAAVCLVAMPRVFGHAHIASLESTMNLAWTITLVGAASRYAGRTVVRKRDDVLTGVLIGLALLTKMQAVLLPPLLVLWLLWHGLSPRIAWLSRWSTHNGSDSGTKSERPVISVSRACQSIATWAVVSLVTLVAGWPWLWSDLAGNLKTYFLRSTDRVSLNVWYQGIVRPDTEVPWHYPWVMVVATVPCGILLAALLGLWKSRRDVLTRPELSLMAGGVLSPLLLFSLPGVAVYDGARLFLVAFPPLAVFAGIGFSCVHQWLAGRLAGASRSTSHAATASLLRTGSGPVWYRRAGLWVSVLLAAQCFDLCRSPNWLGSYNALVGGRTGAERLGFETTYWGDSFSRGFLQRVIDATEPGSTVVVYPVLHQFQLDDLLAQSPMLRRHELKLVAFDPVTLDQHPDALVAMFHRKADASIKVMFELGYHPVTASSAGGVVIASLWSR